MPRPTKSAPTQQPNAIIASAASVVAGRKKNMPAGTGAAWQNEAWQMLDTVGELEFYREWMSNALSRCTLSVVEEQADGTERPVTQGIPADAMSVLFDGSTGQAEMLASMAGHLAIPGETWLVGLVEPSEDPDIDVWRVLSKDEVKPQGSRWVIDRGDGVPETYTTDEVYVTRIWRPHPRMGVEAHSSVRSALPILRELVGLSQHVAASIDSRLAGAGILAVPSEITFATPTAPGEDPDPNADPFMVALVDAIVTAIEDRGSAAALAPFVIKAPAEHLDKIKHITLSTPLSAEARELRKEAIGRLASSLDVPAEVLLGLADVNHWTGWLLDENAIKMHVEPLLSVITSSLTTRYLWPVLQGPADRFDPALRRFRVKGDTSALRQRPNRSAEAQTLHTATVITDAALAREVGFETEDLLTPDSPEFKRRVLMRLALGGQPEVVVAAMDALGVPLTTVDAAAEPAAPPALSGPVTTPEVEDPATDRDLPTQEQAAALLAASELLVSREVERAWNRAGRRGKVRKPVPDDALSAAMTGAWGQVEQTAGLLGVDPARLTAALDGYARRLLTTGADYERRTLARIVVGVLGGSGG